MGRVMVDGRKISIAEGPYTGRRLRDMAETDLTVPVVTRAGRDIVVGPEEIIHIQPTDDVTFVSPMESGAI